jgi:putative membrane protein
LPRESERFARSAHHKSTSGDGEMNTEHFLKAAGFVLVATFVTLALSSCSASREQPAATSSVTNTPPSTAAQGTTLGAKSKPAKHATRSAEASSKSTSGLVLSEIHRADLREITIGQMAEGKASNNEVREYANQLVKDRTSADQQVIAMAQKKNVRLRDKTSKPGSEYANLAALKGPSFDKYFLQRTAADHDKLVRSLRQEREDVSDDDIEALIDKILPILEQDKELTQVLMKKEQA